MARSRIRLETLPEEGPADRLRIALELHSAGVSLVRQRLRREHPDWTEAELEAAVRSWLGSKSLAGADGMRVRAAQDRPGLT